jgi:16S rRNA C1402 N4-methylase RsmH
MPSRSEYRIQLSDGKWEYEVEYKGKVIWTGPTKSLTKYLVKMLKSSTNARNFLRYVDKNGFGYFDSRLGKIGEVKRLLKKFESVNEAMGMDPDKARISILKIYGSSMVQNFKTILGKMDRGKAIKREWKAFKSIVDLIEKKVEEVL